MDSLEYDNNLEEFFSALSKEELEHKKDQEIQRIINSFKLDPYALLELPYCCSKTEVKKQYRKKSLLIHPDKTNNPDAPVAFDLLQKSQAELQDDDKKKDLDELYMHVSQETEQKNPNMKGDNIQEDIKQKFKEALIEIEFKKRIASKKIIQRRSEMAKEEEERNIVFNQRKEAKDNWENTREQRVNNWRTYANKVEKKKSSKKKKKVLA